MSDFKVLTIGGKDYQFSDLNLKALQKIWPMMPILSAPTNGEYMLYLNKALAIASVKDNPDLTEEFLAENVSVTEIFDLGTFISEQLGKLTKKKNPETLAQVTSQSTGGISMVESLQPQDGAGNT